MAHGDVVYVVSFSEDDPPVVVGVYSSELEANAAVHKMAHERAEYVHPDEDEEEDRNEYYDELVYSAFIVNTFEMDKVPVL